MPERERLIEVGVSVAVVLLMLGVMITIGSVFGGENGTLSREGGEMLVAAIVGFIVLLTGVGIALAFVTNDPEDDAEGDRETDAETGSAV